MKTLAEMISDPPNKGFVCITPETKVTRRDLLSKASKLRESGEAISDPIVSGADILSAIPRMIALDGFASALYLAPADLSEEQRARLRDLARGVTSLQPGAKTQWVIATSGTSGAPKLVAHNLQSLTHSLKIDRGVGTELRWALLYDPCRFAGLQVTLQAAVSGSTLLVPESADVEYCIEFLRCNACTSISATPSMWRKVLSTSSVKELRLSHVTLGGEIADDRILQLLHATFPQARITHIYASTEAGVGFSVRDGRAGFPAEYLKTGPSGKVKLRISTNGILQIHDESFEQEYVGQSQRLIDRDGFIDTGDLVKLHGDRVFFLGRANGSINVGGQKVMPEEVESLIRSCPGVEEARVYSKPSPILGSIVMAEVVAGKNNRSDEVREQLKAMCHMRLEPFKRPVVIHMVDEIKVSAAGKIRRAGQ